MVIIIIIIIIIIVIIITIIITIIIITIIIIVAISLMVPISTLSSAPAHRYPQSRCVAAILQAAHRVRNAAGWPRCSNP